MRDEPGRSYAAQYVGPESLDAGGRVRRCCVDRTASVYIVWPNWRGCLRTSPTRNRNTQITSLIALAQMKFIDLFAGPGGFHQALSA